MSEKMDYDQFLASKTPKAQELGFEIGLPKINAKLFPFQKAVVRWACRLGRAAIFAGCGLGKTATQLEWANLVNVHTERPTLILAPLAVAHQTVREGEKFGIAVNYCLDGSAVNGGINITNYERLDKFNAAKFGSVVLDECFAKGTLVRVVKNGEILDVHIENILEGDTIVNAAGLDIVKDTHRREIQYAAKVIVGTRSCVASPNHPFFTQRGWVGAQDLRAGDYVMGSEASLCLVREGILSEVSVDADAAVLRDILLSEMADASTGDFGEGSQSDSCGEAGAVRVEVPALWRSKSSGKSGEVCRNKADASSRDTREGFRHIESDEAYTVRAWGQWEGDDAAAIKNAEFSWKRMESGVCLIVGKTRSRLSDVLQSGLGERRKENRNRGGWTLPQSDRSENSGLKEGRQAAFSRVDGVEILERGNPELDRLRDADGKLYFYDIGATRHPSFVVNGFLVHNSSVLKAYTGKTKQAIIEAFAATPFKLSCTATPAPNDHLELGNQAEFLGVMPSNEMIMRWFVADSMHAGNYRLKGHAEADFWRWMATWAVAFDKPSDLGNFSDDGFILPPLRQHIHFVDVDLKKDRGDALFRDGMLTATTLHKEMRLTAGERSAKVAELVAQKPDEPWIVWCNTNYEADELRSVLPNAVEVRGSDSIEQKEKRLNGFSDGAIRELISKPSIAGLGLNWQHCANVAFVGLSYSFEDVYQAVRRCWRFGQQREVDVHFVCAASEGDVLSAVKRKESEHEKMKRGMIAAMREGWEASQNKRKLRMNVKGDVATGENWTMHRNDSCVLTRDIPDKSVGLQVTSLPFANLYIYSDHAADMGNCTDEREFFEHYKYLLRELYRITIPGRVSCVHCKDLPAYFNRDDRAGLKDFPGDIIRAHESAGWSFHSRVTIWKCPVTERERTNNNGLLHKTIKRDSSQVRQGMADYILVFRRTPDSTMMSDEPVTHPNGLQEYHGNSDPRKSSAHPSPFARTALPGQPSGSPSEDDTAQARRADIESAITIWRRYAEPVWWDIDQTDVLNFEIAREGKDDRHICPLQLGVIRRCIELWSNPGDTVFDPFGGIGSTGHEALLMGRKFLGVELKESYWRIACKNLERAAAAAKRKEKNLFAGMEVAP